MFDVELRRIEKRLTIPYPRRTDFLREMAGDLDSRYQKFIADGYGPDEAKTLALNEFHLSQENVADLEDVHEAAVGRFIRNLPEREGQFVRDYSGIVPLIIFACFSLKEVSMLDFLREGGLPSVITILLIGGYGLSINLSHVFRWFVIKDHSEQSLANFTTWPLYLAAASLLAGLITSALGYRLVFVAWSQGAIQDSAIRAGLSEPLAAVIVAATIAGLIVLLHGWLAHWREKIGVTERVLVTARL